MFTVISTQWLRQYIQPNNSHVQLRLASTLIGVAVTKASNILADSNVVRKVRRKPLIRKPPTSLTPSLYDSIYNNKSTDILSKRQQRLQRRQANGFDNSKKVLLIPQYITVKQICDLINTTTAKLHQCGIKLFDWWPQHTKKQLRNKFGYNDVKNLIVHDNDAKTLIDKYTNHKYSIQLHSNIETSDLQPGTAAQLHIRQPILSILGHVDHGKTTLVDSLRNKNVAKHEEFGITQELYSFTATLQHNDQPPINITILDTPGHHTFTDMRKTAGWFSDINIVVISARISEGLQTQTIEALEVARSYDKTPYILVINKIDADDADVTRLRQQLMDYGLRLVDYTHKFNRLTSRSTVPCIEISAKHKTNFDTLYNALQTTLQRIDLRTDISAVCRGSILESYREDKGRGNVIRLIVQHGTLHKNDWFVCGLFSGCVKELRIGGRLGYTVDTVMPAIPVEIMGCDEGLPSPGTELFVASKQRCIDIAQYRRNEASWPDQQQRIAADIQVRADKAEARIQARLERQHALERTAIDYVDPAHDKRNDVYESIAAKNDEIYEPSIATTFDDVGNIDVSTQLSTNTDSLKNESFAANDNIIGELNDVDNSHETTLYDTIDDVRRADELDDGSPRTIIIKSNHTGGLRMLVDAVDTIHSDVMSKNTDAYGLNLLSCNSGGVNKNDIVLAAVDRSPILLFRTQQPSDIELQMAKQAEVPIRHYRHFERLLNDLTVYATTGKFPVAIQNSKYAKPQRVQPIRRSIVDEHQNVEHQL